MKLNNIDTISFGPCVGMRWWPDSTYCLYALGKEILKIQTKHGTEVLKKMLAMEWSLDCNWLLLPNAMLLEDEIKRAPFYEKKSLPNNTFCCYAELFGKNFLQLHEGTEHAMQQYLHSMQTITGEELLQEMEKI